MPTRQKIASILRLEGRRSAPQLYCLEEEPSSPPPLGGSPGQRGQLTISAKTGIVRGNIEIMKETESNKKEDHSQKVWGEGVPQEVTKGVHGNVRGPVPPP